ncbi:MAG: ATP-dependent DNA helicase [Acidobacteriaceae bacterium]
MLDESSLASTRQMQSFLEKIGPQDRMLLVGDTRQHQGVDAGKPFEQMQEAGMRTSQLDQIMRQKDPELLRAVKHLSRNETATGIQLLQQQGRITEISDPQQRIETIAKDYVARPENTLVVSPDNASRRDINDAIRAELQGSGSLSRDNHAMTVLTQRSELTSADRNWAALYQPADVLYYTRGSKELGIERGTYATVVSTDPKANQITVERDDGQQITYDPKRLHGIAAYREIARDFAEGDRLQFTVSKPEMDVKNRDLGMVERIDGTSMSVRMDGDKARVLTFDASQMRHFDHGYAVTSHSSQGLTTDRVLVNMDTTAHPELINTRFAYVSVSRASEDTRIYTNDAITLAERLSTDISKASAVDVAQLSSETQCQQRTPKEQTTTNSYEQSREEQRQQSQQEVQSPVEDKSQTQTDIDLRHYAPIQTALAATANGYDWKRETGDIQSYQHNERGGWLHIDPQGQFYDRQAQPIERTQALENAGHSAVVLSNDNAQSVTSANKVNDQGLSL